MKIQSCYGITMELFQISRYVSAPALTTLIVLISTPQPFTMRFPRADIHELLTSDLLHQAIKGAFKDHLVQWVEDYLNLIYGPSKAKSILDEIDRRYVGPCLFEPAITPHRIALAPLFPGLRRFKQGRNFKQWTGNDSKALMKVFDSFYGVRFVYLPRPGLHERTRRLCTFRYHQDF